MDCRDNSLELDVGRLQKVGCKVTRLLKNECKDAVEATYVLKVALYLLRCSLIEDGIALDNEAELNGELTGMIDRAINEGK